MSAQIVAGNWKMHGSNAFVAEYAAQFSAAFEAAEAVQVVIFPPALYLRELGSALQGSGVQLGVQTLHPESEGAFTGELSAPMARDCGAQWALVGHSERRQLFGEDDAMVAERCVAALAAGLKCVVCVGETLAQRRAGDAEAVVLRQLRAALDAAGSDAGELVVAYEPVWAIGTGETATPEQAQAMHAVIRGELEGRKIDGLPLLYGGSVKPGNARSLFDQPDVGGGLVGGASLVAADFLSIIAAAVE